MGREVRCSLQTKDRNEAKRRLLVKVRAMTRVFTMFGDDRDNDSEARIEVYKSDLVLTRQHCEHDLDDEFDLEALLSELGSNDREGVHFRAWTPISEGEGEAERAKCCCRSKPCTFGLDNTSLATVNLFTVKTYCSQCQLFLKVAASEEAEIALSALTRRHLHEYAD